MKLLDFIGKEVEVLTKEGLMGRAGNYERTRKSFAKFLAQNGCTDIAICKIDKTFINGYKYWLQGNGLSENSIIFYLRNLHSIIGKAVRIEKDNRPEADAFGDVPLGAKPNVRRLAVDSGTIRELMSMNIKKKVEAQVKNPKRKSTEGIIKRISFARDLFIFSFCAQGMDFVDICYLKKENVHNGQFHYSRHLTGKYVEVAVLPQMQEVMEKYRTSTDYLFPILTTDSLKESHQQYLKALRRYNQSLNELAGMLSGEVNLSSASARDSWAFAAYQRRMPLLMMSKALGLKDEASVLKYLQKFEVSGLGQANKNLIDSILG